MNYNSNPKLQFWILKVSCAQYAAWKSKIRFKDIFLPVNGAFVGWDKSEDGSRNSVVESSAFLYGRGLQMCSHTPILTFLIPHPHRCLCLLQVVAVRQIRKDDYRFIH